MDWGKLSAASAFLDLTFVKNLLDVPLYAVVVQNVPVVGRRIQEFLVFLQNNKLVAGPENIHLIGQSLGAHVSGMAGMYYKQNTTKSVERLTGIEKII